MVITNRCPFRFAMALLGVSVLASLVGCGAGNKSTVTGTVTVDGKPLDNGTIQFYPVDGKGPTGGGGIKDGKFQVEAGVGEMKVVINAPKVIRQIKQYDTPDSPTVDDVKELLPAKYNTKSELTQTLKAGKNDNVNFELKSK